MWVWLALLWLATRKPQASKVSGYVGDGGQRGTDHRGKTPVGVRHTDWQQSSAPPPPRRTVSPGAVLHTPGATQAFDPGAAVQPPPDAAPPIPTQPQTWQQAYGGGGGGMSPYDPSGYGGDPYGGYDPYAAFDSGDEDDGDIVPGEGPGHWERAKAGEQPDTPDGKVWVAD